MISTHTPHAGRDLLRLHRSFILTISTHTPHAGRDLPFLSISELLVSFLLTRPMRGATGPLPPVKAAAAISTHTPHAGRDVFSPFFAPCVLLFLLTRPMRGATQQIGMVRNDRRFLLTRPMRGATLPSASSTSFTSHFYSHAPCGARPYGSLQKYRC